MTTWSRWTPPRLTGFLARSPVRSGYDAFISYSHAGDSDVAAVLQRALHGFARSWYRLRALRVFRDTASLSADPSLWDAIERALASAKFFILIASPEAAQSKWVAKEVEWWSRHKSKEQLLIVLSDGALAWSEQTGDFDWTTTTALPGVLRGVFTQEPLWVDLRFARSARQLSPRHPELREAVATLAATIHGRPRDELIGEDVRRHRRTIQVATLASVSITCLGAAAVWQWIVATDQRNQAREQAAIAVSRQLSAQANAELDDGRLDVGLLLGVTASLSHDTVQARDVLFKGLQTSPELVAFLHDAEASAVALSPDGHTLALGHDNGTIQLWDVATHRKVRDPVPVHGDTVTTLAFSPDGRTLASGAADFRAVLQDLDTGERTPIRLTTTVAGVFFDSDGTTLVAGDHNGRVGRWDVESGDSLGPLGCARGMDITKLASAPQVRGAAMGTADGLVLLCDLTTGKKLWGSKRISGGIDSLAVGPRGLLAAGTGNGSIVVWNAAHERIAVLRGHGENVSALSFRKDGSLASGGLDGAVLLWPPVRGGNGGEKPKPVRTLRVRGSDVVDLVFGGGGLLAQVNTAGATLWNVARRDRIGVDLPAVAQNGALTSFAFAGDKLASGDDAGTVWIRDTRTGRATRAVQLPATVSALAFSRDGTALAAGDVSGAVKIWNGTTGGVVATLSVPQRESVMGLAFVNDARALLGADRSGRLLTWNLSTGEPTTLATRDAGIQSLAGSPGRDTLALVDGNGDVVLATPRARTAHVSVLGNHESAIRVAYAPNGSWVASAGMDGSIRLWDPDQPDTSRVLESSLADTVTSLAFSTDSRLLAASAGSEVRVWDVRARDALGLPLGAPRTQLFTVAFRDDGLLVTGGLGSSPLAWATSLHTWRSLACATANRTLTETEWEAVVGDVVAYDPPCSSEGGSARG